MLGDDIQPEKTTYGDPHELAVYASTIRHMETTPAVVAFAVHFSKIVSASQKQFDDSMMGRDPAMLRLSRYYGVFPMCMMEVNSPGARLATSPVPHWMSPARWLRRICEIELEQHGRDLPFYLGALFYAGLHPCSPQDVAYCLLMLSRTFDRTNFEPLLVPARSVADLIEPHVPLKDAVALLQALGRQEPLPVRGTYAAVRWLHHLSRALWTPQCLVAANAIQFDGMTNIDRLTAMHPLLRAEPGRYWQIGASHLRQGPNPLSDWVACTALQAGPPPTVAGLKFLLPRGRFPDLATPLANIVTQFVDHETAQGTTVTLDELHAAALLSSHAKAQSDFAELKAHREAAFHYLVENGHEQIENIPDPDRTESVALALLAQAREQAAFAPSGGYRLRLPRDLLLRRSGVVALRLWFEPHADRFGAWVRLEQGEDGEIFWWEPDALAWPCPAIVPFAFWPLVRATLAAAYRDLRVAGQMAFVDEPAPAQPPSSPAASASAQSRNGRRHRHHGRTLPTPCLREQDRLERDWHWGADEDVARIRRVAHGVRGHLRRLRVGHRASSGAVERASFYGLTPPSGHTFVRPHVRGGDEAEAALTADATAIHARGLLALVAFLEGGEPAMENQAASPA